VTTLDDLGRWGEACLAFPARFADRFARRESRQQAAEHRRGLLTPVERENGWQVAEAVGDAPPGRRQRLLSRVGWEMDAARDRRQAFGCETFGDPEGIGILDESGFLRSVAGRGDRAGPGRGPALAELVPPPHPVLLAHVWLASIPSQAEAQAGAVPSA
jgi:hypothetical protein